MKKKLFLIALTAAMLSPTLTGCASGEPAAPAHTHAAPEGWDRNATEHWHTCECGEKLDAAAHALDDMNVCTVCGSEIIDWGDGTFNVYDYDETGAAIRDSSFSKGGELLMEYVYEREYDADGNPVLEKMIVDGVLCTEASYTTDENGTWQTGYTDYYEDGSKVIAAYNIDGEITHSQHFNADGVMELESFTEYAYTDNGESYGAKYTEITADGEKLYAEYNQYEDVTLRQKWAPDGTLTYSEDYEYGYNDEGNRIWVKEYRDGRLIYEILGYMEVYDDYGHARFPETTVEYYENDTKLVTVHGVDSEPATKTWYNAAGEVVHELTFTYEYDDEGSRTRMLTYDDGELIMESEYKKDSNGWTYLALETEFRPDGTKLVREYDENEEIISETEYGKG